MRIVKFNTIDYIGGNNPMFNIINGEECTSLFIGGVVAYCGVIVDNNISSYLRDIPTQILDEWRFTNANH